MTDTPISDAVVRSVDDSSASAPVPTDFDAFYRSHRTRIERALILTLGSRELGQDASAEAFTRAFARWHDVCTYDNPRGWLYRVGVNWARSRRRRRRREVTPEEWNDLARSTDQADSVADDAIHDDIVVTNALSQLSLEHRMIVVGRFYLDWSEHQLADALDIAPGTVKSRSSRALDRLTELLEDAR